MRTALWMYMVHTFMVSKLAYTKKFTITFYYVQVVLLFSMKMEMVVPL